MAVPAIAPLSIPQAYAAGLASGPGGGVERWGDPLSETVAVARMQSGEDVVISGGADSNANRAEARRLAEIAFGTVCGPEQHRGQRALFHFHPASREPDVHVFFDSVPKPFARKR